MKYSPEKYHRHSIRLRGYDYTLSGYYFITACTYNKECFFGEIAGGKMQIYEFGKIAEKCWNNIPEHFIGTILDEFIIMPNHIHGIINVGAHASPLQQRKSNYSLGTVIGSFKAATTREINRKFNTSSTIWQRNYYDRIIRNEQELINIKEYIINNPAKWETNNENSVKNKQAMRLN